MQKIPHIVGNSTYSHHVSYGICLSFRSDSLILLILNGKRKQDELDTLVLITNVIQSFRPYKYYLTIKKFQNQEKAGQIKHQIPLPTCVPDEFMYRYIGFEGLS